MNASSPKNLFISLQLHTQKSEKVAKIGANKVGVKVSDDRLKNDAEVEIGGYWWI